MRAKHSRGNVFVANLPPDLSDDELAEAFDPHGIVLSATVARDPRTGRRLRYGFVDIATERAAERAVAAMHGTAIDSYRLDVHRAEPPAKAQKAPRGRIAAGRGVRPIARNDRAGHPGEFAAEPRRHAGFVVERRQLPRRA